MKDLFDFAVKTDDEDIIKSAEDIAKGNIYKSKYSSPHSRKLLTVSKTDLPNAYKAVLKRINLKKDVGLYERRMIDNFYMFEQQIKNLFFSLTQKQLKLLPKMVKGKYKGLPRIYAVVNEMLLLSNCRIDEEIILKYINLLQENITLEMEELDVFKNMLMLRLIDICTMIAEQEEKEQFDILSADNWIKTLKGIVAKTAQDKALDKMMQEEAHSGAFINEIYKQLKQLNKTELFDEYALSLSHKGIDAKEQIDKTNSKQTKRNEIFYACIESVRNLTSMPFDSIYEDICLVEVELKKDDIYEAMDEASRQYYRRRIELISRKYRIPEIEIAKKAVAFSNEENGIKSHVGYYIIDDGIKKLIEEFGQRYKSKNKNEKFNTYRNTIYSSGILLLAFSAYYVYTNSKDSYLTFLVCVFMFLPFYTIAQRILNGITLRCIKPSFMPKIELNELGEKNRTIVISPRVITGDGVVDQAIEDLETYYLANKDENIYFVLLGDFNDSDNQLDTKDIKLMEYASKRIQEINSQYKRDNSIFYYIQRSRGYSETQGKFIPPERKRGAVEYFNDLLLNRDGSKERYAYISEDLPKDVSYVITLDSDTKLILGSAKKLIGTIIHPLNRPVIEDRRVIRGYTIIQPRISTDVISAGKSRFANIYCGQTGLDVYSSAVSDVYMDLFGEGIFTGKGLYDVKAFSLATEDKFESEQILSHDLIEGIITRVGYASDIQLSDGFPSSYISFMKRQHRWVRGDWQLLPLLKKETRRELNIDSFGAFKIVDNLFRSLLPACVLVILLLGLFCNTNVATYIVVISLIALFINVILDFVTSVYVYATSNELRANAKDMLYESKIALFQSLLNIMFLPFMAYVNFNALIRTLFRLTFTRKNMLEWNTFASVEKQQNNSLLNYYIEMISAPIFGIITLLGAFYFKTISLPYFILGVAWIVAPSAAYLISQKEKNNEYALSNSDINYIRMHARRTWAYFEDNLNEENNYLIPDNYQHTPNRNIAHRTSPTNIGLSLASIIAANDLGYLDTVKMLSLVSSIIDTMDKLDKWNGHLYNWYDTKTLSPLHPFFVSSVDSGNLATYMILCSKAIKEKMDVCLINKDQIAGIEDTINLIEQKDNKIRALLQICSILKKEIINLDTQTVVDYLSVMDIIKGHKVNDEWGNKAKQAAKGNSELIYGVLCYLNPLLELKNKLSVHQTYKDAQISIDKIEKLTIDNLTINGLLKIYPKIVEYISSIASSIKQSETYLHDIIAEIQRCLIDGRVMLKKLRAQSNEICSKLDLMFEQMDFSCVYDESKQLFAIGYNLEDGLLSASSYDMLASEARQTSFLAIAKGDVEPKHWFKLSRSLTMVGTGRMLVSWGGTMFEYLMPLLTIKANNNTILGETYSSLIDAHINYGKSKNVPWGVSESGFYKFDGNMYYQYKAFGLPKTGLKSGLNNDTVIAPYATCMALMVKPNTAIKNMKLLERSGALGKYGFYEALDYTKARLYGGKRCLIVKSFMAHHLGMSMLAFDNVLNNNVIQKYFHSIPSIRATQSLLDESIPARNVVMSSFEQSTYEKAIEINDINYSRTYKINKEMKPHVHFLSNGEYTVYLNAFGGGQSVCKGYAVNRFRGDVFTDTKGIFFYIKNIETKDVWSLGVAPLNIVPAECTVEYEEDKAVYTRIDNKIKTKMEVCVCEGRNAELRKITITNNDSKDVELELTSYFELTLSPIEDDWSHAQFYNLFIESYYHQKEDALIFKRRRRSEKERPVFLYSKLIAQGETSYESSRAEFIGRGNDTVDPKALGNHLKNSEGIVIDPCSALRKRVKIEPNKSKIVYYIVGVEHEEADAIKAASINKKFAEEEFAAVKIDSIINLSQLDVTQELLEFCDELKDYVYSAGYSETDEENIKTNDRSISSLWKYGISGREEIVLCYAKGLEQLDTVLSLIKAAEYYSLHGAPIHIIIINKESKGYYEPLRDKLNSEMSIKANKLIHLINISDIAKEDLKLLETLAYIKFDCKYSLREQLNEQKRIIVSCKPDFSLPTSRDEIIKSVPLNNIELQYFNGFGGFANKGRQYTIQLNNNIVPPMPYCNVIANPQFGTLVSDAGICFTFAENSRENKLTKFENDSIESNVSEAVYVRDDETLVYNTVSKSPVKREAFYRTTHGKGYSAFECSYNGLLQEQTINIDPEKKISYIDITITNTSEKRRKLSVYYYADILMGVNELYKNKLLYTGYDNGIIYAKNTEAIDYTGIAFAACPGHEISYSGNKKCFIGDGRSMKNPKAMLYDELDNDVGIKDCCFAIKTKMELNPGQSEKLMFVMGYEHTIERAEKLIEGIVPNKSAEISLEKAKDFWDKFCGKIKISTPDDTFNILINEWLPYQMLSSRVWARTGFYQVGGAFGFRDQLQDMLSIMLLNEDIARKHIVNCASHQFEDGDVQHWWHQPAVGVRTHIKDDLLFLPYVVAEYVEKTGDDTILNEKTHYLKNVYLDTHKEDVYIHAEPSENIATIHEHCKKAIEKAMVFGEHGLPLIGRGDWNDGMNNIGPKGKGESVWLGFFMYQVLDRYLDVLKIMGEEDTIAQYELTMKDLKKALNTEGWDGNWFKRAFFDDGTPIGSIYNDECKIDCISQAFSVISGAGSTLKKESAMESVYKMLVDKENGIIKLLWPAFNKSEEEPGYIKGYNPGIRENGGQYTHGAIWAIIAFAKLKEKERAYELFSMLNPINHTETELEARKYKGEPYVMAADVYDAQGQKGRSGWTWYTGSASWMYKAAIEDIIGFKKQGDKIIIDPCLPDQFNIVKIEYKYLDTIYRISIENNLEHNKSDKDKIIKLVNDKEVHDVIVRV